MFDVEKFADGIWKALSKQLEPLVARVKALEDKPLAKDGEPGKDGADGTSITADDVKPLIDSAVQDIKAQADEYLSAMPAPKDGESITMEDVQPVIDELKSQVSAALADIKQPEDGKDGVDGKDGTSITVDDVMPTLQSAIEEIKSQAAEVIAGLTQPKDGAPGQDGKDGKDGTSVTLEQVTDWLSEKMARWELDFERRAMDMLQKCADRMPAPKDGKDGIDGLGFDNLRMEFDGERTLTLAFKNDGQEKSLQFKMPTVIYQGIYSPETSYEKSDSVTFGGSTWIAVKDAPTGKPGEPGADGWKLAVKAGRNGKDGLNGKDYTAPVKLEPVK